MEARPGHETKVGLIASDDAAWVSRAKSIREVEGVQLAVMCASNRLPDELGEVEWCTDANEVIGRPDLNLLAIIGHAGKTNSSLVLEGLRAGKDVAFEVSGLRPGDIVELEEAAGRAGRRIAYLGCLRRWGPNVIARAYLERGDFGKVYQADIHFRRAEPRPDLVVRDGYCLLDSVFHLLGWPEVTSVSAACFGGEAGSDECEAVIRTASGVPIALSLASGGAREQLDEVRVWGTMGGMVIQDFKRFHFRTDTGVPDQVIEHTSDWKDPMSGDAHVIVSMRDRTTEVVSNSRQARAMVEVLEMLERSSVLGRELTRQEYEESAGRRKAKV